MFNKIRELIINLLDLWFTVSDTDLIVDVRDDYVFEVDRSVTVISSMDG